MLISAPRMWNKIVEPIVANSEATASSNQEEIYLDVTALAHFVDALDRWKPEGPIDPNAFDREHLTDEQLQQIALVLIVFYRKSSQSSWQLVTCGCSRSALTDLGKDDWTEANAIDLHDVKNLKPDENLLAACAAAYQATYPGLAEVNALVLAEVNLRPSIRRLITTDQALLAARSELSKADGLTRNDGVGELRPDLIIQTPVAAARQLDLSEKPNFEPPTNEADPKRRFSEAGFWWRYEAVLNLFRPTSR